MRCIAHRGFAAEYPENTIPAVEQAIEAGADGVEIDVRRCGTGELVVIHDETVNRVTNSLGRVSKLSLTELQSLDVLETGRGVPTLDTVVASVPDNIVLNVELKETGIGQDVVSIVADTGPEILVSSFETAALDDVSDASDLPVAFLCRNLETGLDTAGRLNCHAIHPHERSCSVEAVDAAQAAGLRVNAWTVRSRETARQLRHVDVDGLISDSPAYCNF